jgi:signal transduction histidine kinase
VARFDGDWATVDVADTGVGMAPELIDRLFDSSEHITTLGTADERGTGLGLNLCHYLSTRLGGSIAVESEPARGSVFHFRLPSRAR